MLLMVFQLVPDPDSNRCKVVIGSCELDKPYKVYVVAVPEGMLWFEMMLIALLHNLIPNAVGLSI